MRKRKIGIFDSGLGGLIIARAIRRFMPGYDYVYLGDTKNLPYGNKSQAKIYANTKKALEYLFEHGCVLVIVACNTASSQALRKIQQEWLPARNAAHNAAGGPNSKYKDRKVLGVIRPTVESIGKSKNVGLIGTVRTVDSKAYKQELYKINPKIKLLAKATPELVPMIEKRELDIKVLKNYLASFKNTDTLILGCTHYGLLKKEIKKILGPKVKIIAQEDIIPGKLKKYLKNHREIRLSKGSGMEFLVTKKTPSMKGFSPKLISLS